MVGLIAGKSHLRETKKKGNNMSLIYAKRLRLIVGIVEEIKANKMDIITLILAVIVGLLIGIYFGFVFFYLTGK